MFESLLIANRGEIACRIARTARRLGIRTVAVYSQADADARHVQEADEAIPIGGAPARESYLNQEALLEAIAASNADAVHPGYGFFSENADFASAVADAGAVFVGPSPAAIRAMGSKIEAKRLVAEAGTAVVPGYRGEDQSERTLALQAERIGYPVLIKASMGGGGKGMRVVKGAAELSAALAGAKREAAAAFGDEAVLLERYLRRPKHIEVQILADHAGKTLSLFERDCSVQRRHQKVIEEAPAPTVDSDQRHAMGEAAIRAARAIDYVGAGTVEFIVAGGDFYFLEMNTRLQVEHPVTEAILGLDLVEWQLRVAVGEPLPFDQEELTIDGHAVEARIYAENPKRGFLPSTGTLHRVEFPREVRVDSGVGAGSSVTMHYDPMLAKVIAHGASRRQAIAKLAEALRETVIAGVEHNVAWLIRALGHSDFQSGGYTTDLVEQAAAALTPNHDARATAAAFVATALRRAGDDPWSLMDGFQANLPHEQTIRARRGRRTIGARLVALPDGYVVHGPEGDLRVQDARFSQGLLCARMNGRWTEIPVLLVGNDVFATHQGATERLTILEPDAGAFGTVSEPGGRMVAPMPGRVVAINVAVGDWVKPDQVLAVLEAMKMEHNIRAAGAGKVTAIHCATGERVDEGSELISLDAGDSS